MKYLLKQFKILRAVALVTYKEWAAYRTHSMVSIFVGPMYFLVQAVIWTSVYSGTESINGITLQQMLAYYGVSTLIVYLTMDFADWNLQMLIHTGKYLTFALRPLHHRFFALSQKIGHRILGFIFEFIPVYIVFLAIFKIKLIPASLFWFLLSAAFSFLITFYINYSVGIMGFWLTKTSGLRSVVKLLISVSSGALIPLPFFPLQIQKILFFLPFQHMIYVPSMLFSGEYQLAGQYYPVPYIVGLQGCFVLLTLLLSEILYRLGNRRFTGVGA